MDRAAHLSIQKRPYRRHLVRRRMGLWALAAACLAAVVVMLGAFTRLENAGLGCPDWPGCYGFLHVPQSPHAIAIAETRFPDDPVLVDKGWPEMIHRYFAGTLGLVVFGLAFYGWRHRHEGVPVGHALAAAGMIVLQAAFGMWTVTLKLWPQVVSAHLLGGFTTVTLLGLLSLRLLGRRPSLSRGLEIRLAHLKPWVYTALGVVIAQIALGAWTASNYAAIACTQFPSCNGQWWPAMDVRQGFDLLQTIGPNYLGGQMGSEARVAIHMMHRLGALAVVLVVGSLLLRLWWMTRGTELARWVLLAAAVLTMQIALGISNVVFHLPLAVAVAHNAMGAGLLLSMVNLGWRLQHCHGEQWLALHRREMAV